MWFEGGMGIGPGPTPPLKIQLRVYRLGEFKELGLVQLAGEGVTHGSIDPIEYSDVFVSGIAKRRGLIVPRAAAYVESDPIALSVLVHELRGHAVR